MPRSTSDSARSNTTGVQLTHDAELLIQRFLPPSLENQPIPQQRAALPLPLCIPQTTSGFMQPIARGYNEILNDPQIGISQETFFNFIDGLNLAMTASPPLRVVNVVGIGIGFVPYHWTIIAGIVLQVTATTATHALSKTITDRYLRAANTRLFKPKGLVVRLCTTPAMMALITSEEERKKTRMEKAKAALNKTGRVAGSILLRLPLPLASKIVRSIADAAPHISASSSDSLLSGKESMQLMINRRLQLVEGYALPLDFHAPPPNRPEGIMEVMNSWGVKFDTYRGNQREKKREANRRLASGGTPQTLQEARTQRRDQQERELGRARGGLLSGIVGLKESRLETRVRNDELLEHWGHKDTLWMVVMNADNDEDIEGIEIAENWENEERVDDEVFREIIRDEEEE